MTLKGRESLAGDCEEIDQMATNKQVSLKGRGFGWVVAQIILTAGCALLGWIWPGQWTTSYSDEFVAALLTTTGAAFGVSGVWVLGRNRTIYPEPRPESSLVKHGIYRHVRHPLYTSVMLLAFAWGFWRESLAALIGAFILTLFLGLKARNEEGRLLQRFPDYAVYRRSTRRFLPWLF